MWKNIKRFMNDLHSESLISAIIIFVFGFIGASYIVSGLPKPLTMQELEQVAQSTTIVIGQSIMSTGLATAFFLILMMVITTQRRWKQEDQFAELQNTVNLIAEQQTAILDKLDQLSPLKVKADEPTQVDEVIAEPVT